MDYMVAGDDTVVCMEADHVSMFEDALWDVYLPKLSGSHGLG
jgi:hypothetical protein